MLWKSLDMAGKLILLTTISLTYTLELPTWDELSRRYPGYKHKNNGRYSNLDVFSMIGRSALPRQHKEDTTALRLSIAFNRLGGEHRLGTDEFHITKNYDKDSVKGRDGQQYIFRSIAYGPFLAMKYKSPELIRIDKFNPDNTLKTIQGRQGVIRFVTFLKHQKQADARILLWDCDHLYKSRDFTHIHHLISVEFWELRGSSCPTASS